jgi:hypothetical protein
MARRVLDVTVEAEGRDHGKTYRLTEMDAWAAEEWGFRALTVMSRSNSDLPVDVIQDATRGEGGIGGLVAIAAYGVRALISASFEEAKPLLDEMMACVRFIPSPQFERALLPEDTEEIATRLWLRDKIVEMHSGFSSAGVISTFKALTAAVLTSLPPTQT